MTKKKLGILVLSITTITIIICLAVLFNSKNNNMNDLGGYKPTEGITNVKDNYDEGLYLFVPDKYAYESEGGDMWCLVDETQEYHEKHHTFETAYISVNNILDDSTYLSEPVKSPRYLYLNNNQEIEFEDGILYPIDKAPEIVGDFEIMLYVGRDIEAGTYEIYMNKESADYAVGDLEAMVSGTAYPGYSLYTTDDLMKGYSEPTEKKKFKYLPEYVELSDGDFIVLDKYTGIR